MEAIWPEVITALVSVGASYGVMRAEINNMKKKIERFDADHDLLVRIDEKINGIIENQKKLEEQQIKNKKIK